MGTQLQPSQLNSPGKDIESYLSSVHSIPILTKEEAEKIASDLIVEVIDVLHMENSLSSNDS